MTGGYYLFIRLWIDVAGQSDVAFRIPSVIGVAAAAAIAPRIAARFGGRGVIMMAGALTATQPNLLWASQLARGYGLMAGAVAGVVILTIRLDEKPSRATSVELVLVAIASSYLQLYSLMVVALCIAWLWWRRNPYRVSTAAIILIATVPQAVISASQATQVGWLPHLSVDLIRSYLTEVAGHRLLLPVLIVFVIGAVQLVRSRSDVGVLVTATAVVPGVFLLVASIVHPLFYPRYITDLIPLSSVVAAVGIAWLLSRVPQRGKVIVAALVVATVVLGAGLTIRQSRAPYQYDDPTALSDILNSQATGSDLIVFSDGLSRDMIDRYETLPAGRTPDDIFVEKTGQQTGDFFGEIYPVQTVAPQLLAAQRVWVEYLPPSTGYDPTNPAPATLQLLANDHVAGKWTAGEDTLELLTRPT